jgi:hypothetical protein
MREDILNSLKGYDLDFDNKEENLNLLKDFIKKARYLEPIEQIEVCKYFRFGYKKHLFAKEYRQRFYDFLFENITTCADVEYHIGVPQKYLTTCKIYYEEKYLLRVLGFGVCPVTKSRGVQYLSTNPDNWDLDVYPFENNQLKLF